MPSAVVNLHLAELDESVLTDGLQAIVDLDLDDDVELPTLLPAAPMGSYRSRVLGYTETVDRYAWQIALSMDPAGWTKQEEIA